MLIRRILEAINGLGDPFFDSMIVIVIMLVALVLAGMAFVIIGLAFVS